MSAEDFIVDFASAGSLMGLNPTSPPEVWIDQFGREMLREGKSKSWKFMLMSFGLLELGYERSDRAWRGALVSLQFYNMWSFPDRVPPLIEQQWGTFPRWIPYSPVKKRLEELGIALQETPGVKEPDGHRVHVPTTGVDMIVEDGTIGSELPVGAVYRVSRPRLRDEWT